MCKFQLQPYNVRMTFNEYLRKAREERRITKTDLARRLQVSIQYIVEVESGRSKPPTLERCSDIAKSLALSTQETSELVHLAVSGRASEEIRPFVVRESQAAYSTSKLIPGRDLFLVSVSEDLPADAGLRKGDVALVDKKAKPKSGDWVVVQQKNSRRFLRYSGKENLEIAGVVCGVLWK